MVLVWKSINIKDWYTKYPDEILFVVHGSETPIEHGIFEGYNKLTKEELKKFNESPACYYYNGKRCEKENEEDAEKRKYENLPEEKKKEVKQKVRARAVSVVPRVERRSTIARAECLKLITRAIRRSVARRPKAAVPDRALTSPNPPSANRSTR